MRPGPVATDAISLTERPSTSFEACLQQWARISLLRQEPPLSERRNSKHGGAEEQHAGRFGNGATTHCEIRNLIAPEIGEAAARANCEIGVRPRGARSNRTGCCRVHIFIQPVLRRRAQ